jgi:tetratricopeptide (TPR) repeat protein
MELFWDKSACSQASERLDDVASSLRKLLRPPGCTAKILHLQDGNQLGLFHYEMTMRWNVYHGGNTIQAHQGLHLWLDELEQFVKTTPNTQQIVPLLSISYQLHGSLFRDEMNYSEAHKAYQRAYLAADECNNPELKSASLARRGVAYIQQKQPIDAVQYLEYALTQIEKRDFPYLLAYIHQALSEAHAMLQQQKEAQRNISLAEQALTRKGCIAEMSNCSSNTTSVTAQKGVNAVLLKDYHQALTFLDTGLAKYDPMLRRGRARLIAQKAEAYYGLELIEESIKTAIEALILAQTIGSQKTMNRVRDLHSLLEQSRYRKEKDVVQLGTMLATL